MNKTELRKLYKQKRQQLTAGESAVCQQAMLRQLEVFDWPPVHHLFAYQPLLQRNEPDTGPLIRQLCTRFPHCVTAYPVTDAAAETMQAVVPATDAAWAADAYGIPVPAAGRVLDPGQIDMVLLPLLAFDMQGGRVGYGKGFYDKYLQYCRADCLRVGLSFFGPVAAIEGLGEFDVPLTHCITPDKVYVF